MRISLLLFALLYPTYAEAQSFFPAKKYPSRSYINPMNFPISLAGNFGECRPNHFHSGIDIRTNKVENQSVRAIQSGFVSRVKIDAVGFGNALYITHADGQTSLYAHLNAFYPELQAHILRKQYESKSWKQDIYFMPHQFPIQQGKFIAWSGNTGSSEAPHLHMEIRDTKSEAPLNPLLFYQGLTDTKAPIVKQLAIYDATKSVYEQKPRLVTVSKQGNIYKSTTPIIKSNTSKVYVGINGDDYMENALGTLGIYEMRMFVDGTAFFAWQLDNISYDVTRYMNAQADYKTKKQGGSWIQLCAQLPGDKLEIYKSFTSSKGVIDLSDGQEHKLRIEVYDTKGNNSAVECTLQGSNISNKLSCANELLPNRENSFKNEYIEFKLDKECLYDAVCFKTSIKPSTSNYSHIYQVHFPYVPLHVYYNLKLTPKASIPLNLKDKIAVIRYPYGKETKKKGVAAALTDGKVIANVRDFGDYEIVIDQKAPLITSTIKNNDNISKAKRINFNVKEETTSVKTYTMDVDGIWLRTVQKGDNFYYEMDSHFPQGTHKLNFAVTDENGNMSKVSYTLTK